MIPFDKRCPPELHCFHRDSIALMTHPPKYRKKCCHCGHEEYEQVFTRKPPGEHGPFYRE